MFNNHLRNKLRTIIIIPTHATSMPSSNLTKSSGVYRKVCKMWSNRKNSFENLSLDKGQIFLYNFKVAKYHSRKKSQI